MNIKNKGGYLLFFILSILLFCGTAYADLHFKPFVKSYRTAQSPKWEQDAEVLGEVWWDAPSPGGSKVTFIDGSYLYDRNIFVYSTSDRKPYYLNETDLPGLSEINDSQYRTAAGDAKFIRTIPGAGSPLDFSQKDYRAYTPVLQVKENAPTGDTSLIFNRSFAKVGGKDSGGNNIDITNGYTDLQISISQAQPPQNFVGPTSAVNVIGTTGKPVGNTVIINWTDLNNSNNPFLNDDTPPIVYDVYHNVGSDFAPSDATNRVTNGTSGSSITYGNRGIPGTPILADRKDHYFRMRAKDSTTAPDVLNKHKTTNTDRGGQNDKYVMVHVNDWTAPENFSINTMNPENQKLTIGWSTPSDNANDLAGYIVIRKEITEADKDPTPPNLGGASGDNNGPDYSGINPGNEIIAGTGWIKVAQVSSGTNSIVDTGLDNKKKYKYAVYAYDVVNNEQQGRNYSTRPATRIGQPGEAPNVVLNLTAVSSPAAGSITVAWDWEPSTLPFTAGAKGVYTVNKDEWMALNINSPEAFDYAASGNPSETLVLSQIGGAPLDMSKIYYFKVFSYNDARMSRPQGAMAASLPAGGGTGISTLTYNLKASASDKLVVNSITVPAGAGINKASQLIALINEKARKDVGKDIVIVLGKWDPVTGTAVGLKPDGEGTDFDLKPGEGYQLYVNEDFTLTLP